MVRVANSRIALPAKALAKNLRETYYNEDVLFRIEKKTAPLSVQVSSSAPRRVNLLIPEINFRNFYGGYIAKFNLAQMLARRGQHVRIITVDQCVYDIDLWKQEIQNYPGLENVFDQIEVECHFGRKKSLVCNPGDGVVATTWWSAYIADALTKELSAKDFVYLIQEYEPFTFPLGTYYAIAHESYAFPHKAVFSSGLLREYFELNKIGNHLPSLGGVTTNKALHFENAIVRFDPASLDIGIHRSKKLLFYARPEAHASRNMFELAYLALAKAIKSGAFDEDDWEFHGIGSSHGDIGLPGGRRLQMLGKFGLAEYHERLKQYDLGLSLMYTPHPSLLPLEMAAAGLVVVSNECMNKTADKLASISPNIIAARPNLGDIAKSIAFAVDKTNDQEARRRGANVNWAGDWETAFSEEKLVRIENWLT